MHEYTLFFFHLCIVFILFKKKKPKNKKTSKNKRLRDQKTKNQKQKIKTGDEIDLFMFFVKNARTIFAWLKRTNTVSALQHFHF